MKLLSILFGLLSLCPCYAQTKDSKSSQSGHYAKSIRQARHYVDSLLIAQNIPGISVCVGNGQHIFWAEGFGFADLENHVPVSTNSKFRLGSVSKSLTSFALGKLVQDYGFDLDAPIVKYFPSFPERNTPLPADNWRPTRQESAITARTMRSYVRCGIRVFRTGLQFSAQIVCFFDPEQPTAIRLTDTRCSARSSKRLVSRIF